MAPTKATVNEYLKGEWLPAAKSTIRESTFSSYVQHVECHVVPFIGTVKLQKVSGATLNGLYAEAGRVRAQERQAWPLPRHRPPRAQLPAPGISRRRAAGGPLQRNPADSADPPPSARHRTPRDEDLDGRAVEGPSSTSRKDDLLYSLWHTLAMSGMRRGEGLGLRWEDVGSRRPASVSRALIPTGREVVVSEPRRPAGGGRRVGSGDGRRAQGPGVVSSTSRRQATRAGATQATSLPRKGSTYTPRWSVASFVRP